MRLFLSLLTVLFLAFTVLPAHAQSTGADAFRATKLPLPRMVSLKNNKVYVRTGPGTRYPIQWIYQREGMPVEIIEEYETWRKIRDHEGGEGWINATMLSGQRTVLFANEDMTDMREGFSADARLIARVEPGVTALAKKCIEDWCEVSTGGFTGWVKRNSLWGIYDGEELN